VGRRSGVETVAQILSAFIERRRWRQAELAQHIAVTVPSLRKHLLELSATLRLQSTTEHPDVFWERPKDWHPAGAVVSGADVAAIVRLLGRAPRHPERERLLRLLLQLDPRLTAPTKVHARDISGERVLTIVEDAVMRRQPLRMEYLSARRGDAEWRVASVLQCHPWATIPIRRDVPSVWASYACFVLRIYSRVISTAASRFATRGSGRRVRAEERSEDRGQEIPQGSLKRGRLPDEPRLDTYRDGSLHRQRRPSAPASVDPPASGARLFLPPKARLRRRRPWAM
jgi:hypothetical protein